MAAVQYEIVVRGRLGDSLTRLFDHLEVARLGPDGTRLRGWFADQAALQGILMQLGERRVEIVSVRTLEDTG